MKTSAIIASVKKIMTAPDGGGTPWLRGLLRAASIGYGAAVSARTLGYDTGFCKAHRLPCKVLSIGNITVGGTGKTPMVVYTARCLLGWGLKVAVLSRGYRGSLEKTGGIVSDGRRVLVGPEAAGDEPFMMAGMLPGVPVLVGRQRYQSGCRVMAAFSPDVVLLDDGFQHRAMARDVDLVLLDARQPFGNGYLTPRGTLREPRPAIGRAHAVILTRCRRFSSENVAALTETLTLQRITAMAAGRPVFCSDHRPLVQELIPGGSGAAPPFPRPMAAPPADILSGRGIFAFSGIADNGNFHDSLAALGADVVGHAAFPDHHRYTDTDIRSLGTRAVTAGAELMATTAKDHVKLGGSVRFPLPLAVMDVAPDFGPDTTAFETFLRQRLMES